MQVKKFEAPTMQEALEVVKRELGPEAVILHTRNHKKGFGLLSKASVEVTAAIAEKSMLKKKVVETILPGDRKAELEKLPAHLQAKVYDQVELTPKARSAGAQAGAGAPAKSPGKSKITATRYIDIPDQASGPAARVAVPAGVEAAIQQRAESNVILEEEIRNLRNIVQELRKQQDMAKNTSAGPDVDLGPALSEAFQTLLVNGVDRRYALQLVNRVRGKLRDPKTADAEAVQEQLAQEIIDETHVLPLLDGIRTKSDAGFSTDPQFIAFVGPTGVGKTTTLAKIASDAVVKRGMKVGLINIDTYRAGAKDQLSAYSKLLNLPCRSVSTREEMELAVQDFSSFDLVLIDTAGRSQRDLESLTRLKALLSVHPQMRVELVLSATVRDQELNEMGSRFGMFKPEGLILSKLDEAMTYGSMYNISHRLKLPILYFTTGQRVPEDLEEASPERMAVLLTGIL
jgi:flagellar biosynthesis protein FlhF